MAKTGQFGIMPSTSGGGGGGIVTITQLPQTPSAQDISGLAGNTLATWKTFTFVVSTGSCLIGGVSFGRGTYTYDNGAGTLNALSYDATGSTNTKLLIQL
jgi:hypothetical protein